MVTYATFWNPIATLIFNGSQMYHWLFWRVCFFSFFRVVFNLLKPVGSSAFCPAKAFFDRGECCRVEWLMRLTGRKRAERERERALAARARSRLHTTQALSCSLSLSRAYYSNDMIVKGLCLYNRHANHNHIGYHLSLHGGRKKTQRCKTPCLFLTPKVDLRSGVRLINSAMS